MAKVRIRQGKYRDESGWHLYGYDPRGRRVKVFVPESLGRDEAERIRSEIMADREWRFNV